MKEVFSEIRQRVRLAEYLASKYGLVVGKGDMACCPFHEDKTPSFHVINNERFHCFSCNENGDAIDFVQKHDNIPFMDAVRAVAGDVGVRLSAEDQERVRQYRSLQERNQKMLTRAKEDLAGDMQAEGYLDHRKISAEAREHFGVGYRPDLNAISIPIKDKYDRIVGYSMRMLDPDAKPKYKNSFEDEYGLFKKIEILYNLGACRRDLKDRVYICEGYFDVIAMWQMGYKNTIGICSAIMTKEQAVNLHEAIKPTTEIVFVPDTDAPGLEALEKNIALMRAHSKERSVKVVILNGGKDVSESYQSHGERVRVEINAAIPAEKWLLEQKLKEPDRAKQYQLVRPILMSVSPLMRDDLVDYLATSWGKSRSLLAEYFESSGQDIQPQAFADPHDQIDSYTVYVKELATKRVRFGYPSLDRFMRGIAPGEVAYIQARTSVGKTAAMLNLLSRFSKMGHTVLFFSLEQQKEQIFERSMQIANGIPGPEIEHMTANLDKRLHDMHSNYYDNFKNVFVCDKGRLTVEQIRSHILQFAATRKMPAIVAIDYFGYVGGNPKLNDYERASEKAKEIKQVAKELNNAWIVLHQLSRAGGSGGERVTLDMGRDSGVVEESADHMIGLWRPELEKEISDEERQKRVSESKLIWATLKQRSGATGEVEFLWDRRTLRVIDPNETPTHVQPAQQQPSQQELSGMNYTQEPDENH